MHGLCTNKRAGSISARSIAAAVAARAIAVSVLHLITLPQLQLRAQELPEMRGRVLRVSQNRAKETSSQNCVFRFVYEPRNLRRHVVFINGTWQNCGTRIFLFLTRSLDAYWYSSHRVRRVEKIARQGWALQSPARSHETNYRATGGGATCILRSRVRVPVKLVCAKCTEFTMYNTLTKYNADKCKPVKNILVRANSNNP